MFSILKNLVQARFRHMSSHPMFVVEMKKDELFDAYLAAFPEALRQEHNCNACKSFLNHYGHVVAIEAGKVLTLWDFQAPAPFERIPGRLEEIVRSRDIINPFFTSQIHLGVDSNRERLEDGTVRRWEHFFFLLPHSRCVVEGKSIEEVQGGKRTTKEVFERGLETLTLEAAQDVLELINQNNLYRGKEFEQGVRQFLAHKRAYNRLKTDRERSIYAWTNAEEGGRIRNTAIGTLLIDLSEGRDLEDSVKAFEAKVAPANYRRPTSLVTAKMVEQAQKTLEELGFANSLKRRHATVDDVPVSNCLFVHRSRGKDTVFDVMKSEAPVGVKQFARARQVTLEFFLDQVLPESSSVQLLLEEGQPFVSLIAPEDVDAPSMFSWGNAISWTYQNNLTDAIKEKVKRAGGNVEGELRMSLEWFNYDDLDLHVTEPDGNEIYFGNKRSPHGFLDVDMNAGGGTTREPVENITFDKHLQTGVYTVMVHNYCKRENKDFGFNVQIACKGEEWNFKHPGAIASRQEVQVAKLFYSPSVGVKEIASGLEESRFSQHEVNGLLTNRFQKVKAVMFSPNHWEEKVMGNKHLFFILEGAQLTEPLRPFFNEYLHPRLSEHRKVFEILGGKLMVQPADSQMTGVGFSLTQRNQLIVKVDNDVLKVNI